MRSIDITGDGAVNIDDLLALIEAWGLRSACAADINYSGTVDVDDLLIDIAAWN